MSALLAGFAGSGVCEVTNYLAAVLSLSVVRPPVAGRFLRIHIWLPIRAWI